MANGVTYAVNVSTWPVTTHLTTSTATTNTVTLRQDRGSKFLLDLGYATGFMDCNNNYLHSFSFQELQNGVTLKTYAWSSATDLLWSNTRMGRVVFANDGTKSNTSSTTYLF
jgi:hypothetical protein